MSNNVTSVTAAFTAFDREISLDRGERVKAELRHIKVEGVLRAAGLAASTFLQGSFARRTMRMPLKDVDVVVLLPASMAERWHTPEGARQIHGLFKQPMQDAFGSHVSFDQTADAGKALQLCFDDLDFTIDLVAAFPDDRVGSEWVFIADRHEGSWEASNTRTLTRVVAERNQGTGKAFVHQVRMVKEFKAQYPELEDLCGLAAESLTFAAVTLEMPHPRALAVTLRHAASAVLGRVLDPTGVDDLSVKWTPEQRHSFSTAFAKGAARAEEALRLEGNGQFTHAVEVWGSVLGDGFPSAPPQGEAEAIRGLVAGSITSTGRVTTSTAGIERSRPSRAWRSS